MTNTDAPAPVVPGYRTVALLGAGAHGEVWLGHDLDSDEPVALKVRRSARPARAEDSPAEGARVLRDDAGAAAALVREVAVLRRLRHRHVIGLRKVVDLPGGGRAMVLDHAAGGSLAALLARRGPLSGAETSTLLVPLARTLADLHAQGLVHGDLAPGNVLLTGDGRPVLSDLGTARVLGDPSEPAWGTPGYADPDSVAATAAGDVRALAAVGWFALTGGPPDAGPAARLEAIDELAEAEPEDAVRPALLRLLDGALAPEATARPEPIALAWTVWEAVRPAPVRLALPLEPAATPGQGGDTVRRGPGLAGPDDVTHRIRVEAAAVPGPDRRRGARLVRPALVPAGVSVALAGALLGGAYAFGGPAPAARTTSGPVLPADPAALVQQLVGSRAEAFGTASTAPLARVDEPGSPAMRADTELVARLRERGLTLAGLSFTVTDARLLPVAGAAPATVTLTATVRTSAHTQLRGDGSVAGTVPAGGARPVRLVLAATAGQWRVREAA